MRVTVCLCVCKRQRGPGEPNQAFRPGGPVNTAWRLAFVGSEDPPLSLFATWPGTLTVSAALCVSLHLCVRVCKMLEEHQLLSEAFGS